MENLISLPVARPIFLGDRTRPNLYVAFRQGFATDGERELTLYIRADSHFSVSVNGTPLPGRQYADYDFAPVISRLPVPASVLRAGDNVLDILVYAQNEDSSTYRRGAPSLIFELRDGDHLLAASGKGTLATHDTGFVCGPTVEKISPQLSYGFRYDENLADNPFYSTADVLPRQADAYFPRPVPELVIGKPCPATVVETGTYRPCGEATSGARISHDTKTGRRPREWALPSEGGVALMPQDGGAYLIVDLGAETVGYLTLDVATEMPCSFDVGYGEHLTDGGVRAEIGGRNFAFTLTKKAGRMRFSWNIKRLGCRYLEIHLPVPSVVHHLTLCPADYPVHEVPVPLGLDREEISIYRAAVRTLRCCMHEHYEDCPWREQALYAMDSRNQMLFGYDVFGEFSMPRATLTLLAQGQREDGFLELCAPARCPVNIPSFSLIFIQAVAEYCERSGDKEFAAEMLPVADKILHAFDTSRSGWLLCPPEGYWNFYEWAEGLDGGGTPLEKHLRESRPEALICAFYALGWRAYLRLCTMLGKDIKEQESALALFRLAYLGEFFDPSRGAVRMSAGEEGRNRFPALAQVLGVYVGLIPREENVPLLRRVLAGEFSPALTLSSKVFLYESLLRAGMIAEAREDAKNTYLPMIDHGATTLWETVAGDAAFDRAGSLCHGWSAAPLYIYFRLR